MQPPQPTNTVREHTKQFQLNATQKTPSKTDPYSSLFLYPAAVVRIAVAVWCVAVV